MPTGMGEEERFAAAVDGGVAPVRVGGDRGSAGELARELEIVGLLRTGAGLGPDPVARDRARGRLMAAFANEFGEAGATATLPAVRGAAAPATVALAERAEGPAPRRAARAGRHSAPEPATADPDTGLDADDDDAAPLPAGVRRLRPRRAVRAHRRATLVGAAAAAALVVMAAGGTFASRDALPGDTLYGVKRVAESTGYAFTFGERNRAMRHLQQAQRRLDEVEGMVARSKGTAAAGGSAAGGAGGVAARGSAAGGTAADAELLRSTMQDFDADTDEGTRLLLAGPKPDTPPDAAQVEQVRSWATQQSGRLARVRPAMAAPGAADPSLALLDRVLGRTAQLDPACAGAAAPTCGTGSAVAGGGARVTTSTPDEDATAGADATASVDPDDDERGDTAGRTGTRSGGGPDADRGTAGADDGDDGDGGPDGVDDADGSDDADGPDDSRGSRGSGGSGGGGGSGNVSVPLPLPAPVQVPPVAPGLPGLRIG